MAAANARGAILSSKRGFADVGANYANLQATGAGWYYTWGPDAGNPGNFDAQHIPMIWGGTPSQSLLSDIRNRPGVEWLLGFNEPERSDQANMTVAQAVSSWSTIASGLAGSGIKLVSPAVADTGGATGGQAWLASFMSQASAAGLPVDAVAFHWYGVSTPDNPAGAASSFLSRVASYHNQYNKPVFITEFAIHDWGGNYSDEAIIEANRQFLDIVIPELEARDYVAGYSWYHWFNDAHLYEGNPPTPTPMAYSYVGALKSGQVENVGGRDLGEHVAYLAGGELTMTGALGAVRFVNALDGTSAVSGTTNWGLPTGGWIRIQPGATLRKAGSNQLSISRGTLANNGVLEVAQGTLSVGVSMAGTGDLVVSGGTLALTGRGNVANAESIEIRAGGVLDATAASDSLIVAPGQSLRLHPAGHISGDVVAAQNSLAAAGGIVTGNFLAQSGSIVRVGDNGEGAARRRLIDDFEAYTPGKLNAGATGGAWTGVFDGTANAQVVAADRNQSLEYYGTGSSWRGARASLATSFGPDDYSLADGDSATYFFRVQRQGTQTIDGIFGLTDQDSIGIDSPWQELAVTLSLFQDTAAGSTTALRAYDGDGGGDIVVRGNVAAGEWVNVWLVVDNEAKTYQVATSTDGSNGALFPRTFNFGRQSASGAALDTFAGAEYRSGSNPASASIRIDDFYRLEGVDLTNPLANPGPNIQWTAETLSISGDYSHAAGALLQLNLLDPAHHDALAVMGHASLAGALEVTLAVGAAVPQLGDSFDILDFASASGGFDQLSLPALTAGLQWKTSDLLTTGLLEVIAAVPGDFNQDGNVDGADFLAWQRGGSPDPHSAQDLADWQANYGSTPQSPASAAVAEPSCGIMVLVAGGVPLAASRRRRRSGPAEGRGKSPSQKNLFSA